MPLRDALNGFFYSLTISELKLMNEKFKSLNITYNSLLYLDIISYTEKCTISFLADALCISKSAVTIKINEMVKQGLVVKEQSKEDKRVFYLKINNELSEIYKEYNRAKSKAIDKANENFTKEELDIFCKVMLDIQKTYIEEIQNEKQLSTEL